jgi:hypothetical protein
MSTADETRQEKEDGPEGIFDGRLCDTKCYEQILRIEETATSEDRE